MDESSRADHADQMAELTATVVVAYVSKNAVSLQELPALIVQVRDALARSSEVVEAELPESSQKPAVAIRKSVEPGCITCLEDGLRFKSLRRHLMKRHNMTPEQYRTKWQLPASYPMVAPSYAETRSNLAKQFGLGRMAKDL
ncbi:transcriptional regulator [Pseudorhizobium endolithicum]|uniref:Transcriptional regulator n=1 Tax=Pseudorhizobium endolithicum TaxID=1191678 RepID=A0ABN7JVI6_9HYPH|nr:MucR family transcriptional regulator [Pseudorhizobium endolithicum]CAD7044510.1 transcriptional regulator [Pseudorhizobium endolithicum]